MRLLADEMVPERPEVPLQKVAAPTLAIEPLSQFGLSTTY